MATSAFMSYVPQQVPQPVASTSGYKPKRKRDASVDMEDDVAFEKVGQLINMPHFVPHDASEREY